MKTIKLFLKGLLFFLIVFPFVNVKAQTNITPTPGAYFELPSSSGGTSARNTGNDIYVDPLTADTFRVTVWEPQGAPFGISWNVDIIGSGNFQSNDALGISDPWYTDVCLISNGGTVFAIAVYHDWNNSDWYYEPWEWTGTSFTSTGAVNFYSGTGGMTCHIDGNQYGEFVIIFDDNTFVKTVAGDLSGSPVNISGVVNLTSIGRMPDASLNYGSGVNSVHTTYIVSNTGKLAYARYELGDIWNNSPNAYVYWDESPVTVNHTFKFPRISSPFDPTLGDDYSLVVNEDDGSEYNIAGYNYNTYPTRIDYNSGSTNDPNVGNYDAMVTYTPQFPLNNGIWVGWVMDNTINSVSLSGAIDATYPLLVACDNTGTPLSNDAWQIPNNVISLDYTGALSISGRYSKDEVYISYVNYFNNGSSVFDVFNKEITPSSTASSCRYTLPEIAELAENELYSINDNTSILLKVLNVAGQTLVDIRIPWNQTREKLTETFENLNSSIYLVNISSEDGTFNKTIKVFNQP